jgi:uncharacterized membrane protein
MNLDKADERKQSRLFFGNYYWVFTIGLMWGIILYGGIIDILMGAIFTTTISILLVLIARGDGKTHGI